MKILLGTESFSPNISGVAVATEILAGNLADAGHDAFVFCPGDKDKTYRDPNFERFDVLRLPSFVNPFRKGFRITSPVKNEIRTQVLKIKPDIIHIQDVALMGTMLRDIGRELHIPVIVTNHFSLEFALSYVKFSPFVPISRYMLIRYLIRFYNKCALVTAPTETIAKQIRFWGVKTPVLAISNGIFFNRFTAKTNEQALEQFRIKYHLPDNPIVLYTGRIDKDKSIDVNIRAIPAVVKATNAHFVFAGTGDMISDMEALAEKLGVRKDVTFLGRLDHDSKEFINLYKSAKLFAIASTIETQSLVTLEAMAAGLPIVAVNFNALPELVKDGVNGYLFPVNNSKKLAEKIIKILDSDKTRESMGERSKELASHHEISKTFKQMLDLYKETVQNQKIENQN